MTIKVDKLTKEQDDSSKVSKKSDNMEKWVSAKAAQHTIIIPMGDGKESVPVIFKDYALVLDLSNKEQKKISEGLKKSGRLNRDVFIVGEKCDDNDIGAESLLMSKLLEMDIKQLRAFLTYDEMIEAGIPPASTEKTELITVIIKNKQINA